MNRPKFAKTFCSQCGGEFGPGDSGYSHCIDHLREDAEILVGELVDAVRYDERAEGLYTRSAQQDLYHRKEAVISALCRAAATPTSALRSGENK